MTSHSVISFVDDNYCSLTVEKAEFSINSIFLNLELIAIEKDETSSVNLLLEQTTDKIINCCCCCSFWLWLRTALVLLRNNEPLVCKCLCVGCSYHTFASTCLHSCSSSCQISEVENNCFYDELCNILHHYTIATNFSSSVILECMGIICSLTCSLVTAQSNCLFFIERACTSLSTMLLAAHTSQYVTVLPSVLRVCNNLCFHAEGRTKFCASLRLNSAIDRIFRASIFDTAVVSILCNITCHLCLSDTSHGGAASTNRTTSLCDLVLRVIELHIDDHCVINEALMAFELLLRDNNHNQCHVGKSGGCELLCRLMEKHLVSSYGCIIIISGCRIMRSLSFDINNQQRLGKLSACQLLLRVLEIHFLDGVMLATLCSTIDQLCSNSVNALVFSRAGSVDTLMKVMKAYSSDSDVLLAICRTICRVSTVSNRWTVTTIGETNAAVLLFFDTIRLHFMTREELVAVCCRLILTIVSSSSSTIIGLKTTQVWNDNNGLERNNNYHHCRQLLLTVWDYAIVHNAGIVDFSGDLSTLFFQQYGGTATEMANIVIGIKRRELNSMHILLSMASAVRSDRLSSCLLVFFLTYVSDKLSPYAVECIVNHKVVDTSFRRNNNNENRHLRTLFQFKPTLYTHVGKTKIRK